MEDLDLLSSGLAKLMAELARAGPQGEGGGGGDDEDEDAAAAAAAMAAAGVDVSGLSATLRALADQQPQFPGGSGELPPGMDGMDGDFVEKLMAQLGGLEGFGGGAPGGATEAAGEGGDEEPEGMSSFVDVIMQQLLSKEVLYQPMKDIGARYPAWLAANRASLSPEDAQRYEEQQGYILRICELYETDPKNFAALMELLQEVRWVLGGGGSVFLREREPPSLTLSILTISHPSLSTKTKIQMQQRGQPPQEIIDELAPGMSFGPDGLPSFGGGAGGGGPGGDPDCCIQ